MQAKHARALEQAAQDDDDDDDIPQDVDAFRNALARRISIAVSNAEQRWRSCGVPACKRARACTAPHILCSNRKPRRPMKPEHKARAMAQLQRAIRDSVEQADAEPRAAEK